MHVSIYLSPIVPIVCCYSLPAAVIIISHLLCSFIFSPPPLFRHLSAAPFDSDLVCTCYGQSHHLDEEGHPPTSGGVSGGGVTAGLWRLGEEGGELVKVATLTQPGNTRW